MIIVWFARVDVRVDVFYEWRFDFKVLFSLIEFNSMPVDRPPGALLQLCRSSLLWDKELCIKHQMKEGFLGHVVGSLF